MRLALVTVGLVAGLACQNDAPPCDDGWGAGCAPAPVSSRTIDRSTPVADCAAWKTIGEMDGFFATRCGVNSDCHGTGTPFGDLSGPNLWETITRQTAKVACAGARLADSADWRNSALWTKSQSPPSCPPGAAAAPGLEMPPQRIYAPTTPPLDSTEMKCLEGFLRALSAR